MWPDPVGDEHQRAVCKGVPSYDGDVAVKIGEAEFLEHDAEGDGGDGGDNDADGEPALRRDLAAEKGEPTLDEPQHVAPEIDKDGEQRAEMHHDVGDLALVGPAGQRRDEDQMSR